MRRVKDARRGFVHPFLAFSCSSCSRKRLCLNSVHTPAPKFALGACTRSDKGGSLKRTLVVLTETAASCCCCSGVTYPGTGALDALFDFDQLTLARSRGAAFGGFSEARVTFEPTYKYDKVRKRAGSEGEALRNAS